MQREPASQRTHTLGTDAVVPQAELGERGVPHQALCQRGGARVPQGVVPQLQLLQRLLGRREYGHQRLRGEHREPVTAQVERQQRNRHVGASERFRKHADALVACAHV